MYYFRDTFKLIFIQSYQNFEFVKFQRYNIVQYCFFNIKQIKTDQTH